MRKTGLISSKDRGSATQNMQVLDEQSKAYFNFINSLKSESTRKSYTYCIEKFLGHYEEDLDHISNTINLVRPVLCFLNSNRDVMNKYLL